MANLPTPVVDLILSMIPKDSQQKGRTAICMKNVEFEYEPELEENLYREDGILRGGYALDPEFRMRNTFFSGPSIYYIADLMSKENRYWERKRHIEKHGYRW